MFGPRVAQRSRILYGGSVTADTARGYLEIDGIDGLLVGGASLNYHQFSDIVDAAFRLTQETD
jgi:triosephosphate isomerase